MRKLATFSISFAIACILGFLCPLGWTKNAALILLPIFLLSLKFLPRKAAFLSGLLGLFLGLIWFYGYSHFYYLPSTELDNKTIILTATVTSTPSETAYGQSVLVKGGEDLDDNFTILLYFDFDYTPNIGDTISTIAHCQSTSPEEGYSNGSLRSKQISIVATAYGDMSINPTDTLPLSAYPATFANLLQENISLLYSETVAPLMSSLLLGFTDDLSIELTTALRRTGLSHVVAISGMHISFLAAMLLFILPFPGRKSALLQIGLIFFFAAMTGNGAGALRAAILCTAALTAPLFRRESDPITSLFTALFLLLLYNPYAITSVSLQYSFGATLGIYLIGQPLLAHWRLAIDPKWRPLLLPIASIVAISFSAIVFTLPISAYYYSQISIISIFMNLLCSWAVLACFSGGIISLALFFVFPKLAAILALIIEIPAQFFLEMQKYFARFPFASLDVSSLYYLLFFLFFYALLFLTIYWWHRGTPRILLPSSLILLCLSFALVLNHISQKVTLSYTVLSVGQGQSIAISSEDYHGLIDCGGDDYAGSTAASYFLNQGITNLDIVVLTHFHDDHCGGLSLLMSLMSINTLAVPKLESENEAFDDILLLCDTYGTQIMYIEEAIALDFGEAILSIYPPVSQTDDDNEAGLSILTSLGDWDALTTGDMGSDTETLLLKSFDLPDLELLVLGHHGSAYSTSDLFLDELTPDTAAVSVGATNTYGHPADSTLLKLIERNIPLYRTDTMGNITFIP